jgi:hypothetical protein
VIRLDGVGYLEEYIEIIKSDMESPKLLKYISGFFLKCFVNCSDRLFGIYNFGELIVGSVNRFFNRIERQFWAFSFLAALLSIALYISISNLETLSCYWFIERSS